MKSKHKYVPEEECFVDTLLYKCPECNKCTEVAMMVGHKTKDESFYIDKIKYIEDMYIRLRKKFDCLVDAIRIVRKEKK